MYNRDPDEAETSDQADEPEVDEPKAHEPGEEQLPARRSKSVRSATVRSGTVLGAAMLGLGEVLEPEKAKTEVVAEARMDDDDDLGKKFDLNFGTLDLTDPEENVE